MSEAITYAIKTNSLTQHLLNVECYIKTPSEDGQVVSLPAWVPGSYMIRDFAKHVVSIEATSNNIQVAVNKIDKNTWQFARCTGALLIKYQVYCFDLAPRGSYVDHTRIFFDGSRIFLVVEGEEEQTRSVEIIRPAAAQCDNWHCATSMKPLDIDNAGFGKYIASNHLELIDHPFEISAFQQLEFTVAGVPHKLVVSGHVQADLQRLAADVEKICQGHVNFFGEFPDMKRYVFLLNVLGKGYGGIEHRSSCSLLCARNDLPILGEEHQKEEYRDLLGLFSHEYFHLWNVKRIKPEVFTNLDLKAEVYTRQLWIFEGITAYYDNLNLVRTGIITPMEYLQILQKDLTNMQQNPGVNFQTLDDSSFDAWIKFYQPDENTPNSAVSYYLKGSLVALALDLLIIKNSRAKQSLADIMQVLWQQYGKTGLGLPENHFERITYEVTGENYAEFFALALRTTEPLPLPELLLEMGVVYKNNPAELVESLGVRFSADPTKLIVKSVLNGSVMENAGLAPNDIIIAVNALAVNTVNLAAILQRYKTEHSFKLHIFRNDVLLQLEVFYPPKVQTVCTLEMANNSTELQKTNWQKWLVE